MVVYYFFITLGIDIIYTIIKIRLHQINRKQKLEFDTQVELYKSELKALRSQMNPYFIPKSRK